MSDALETQGFEFEIGDNGSPIAYTEVKEVTNFSGNDGQASEIDVSHLKSTAKEFRLGLKDGGNWQLDVNYLPNDPGQLAVRSAATSRQIKNFRATLSDGTVFTFQGFVKSAPIKGGVDAKVDGTYTIRVSGDVTEIPA